LRSQLIGYPACADGAYEQVQVAPAHLVVEAELEMSTTSTW